MDEVIHLQDNVIDGWMDGMCVAYREENVHTLCDSRICQYLPTYLSLELDKSVLYCTLLIPYVILPSYLLLIVVWKVQWIIFLSYYTLFIHAYPDDPYKTT